MSAEELSRIFNAEALSALAPLLAVTAGILLLLVADMVAALARFRGFVVLGALVVAGAFELAHLGGGPGTVLGGSFAANSTTALWGCLFLISTAIAWSYAQGYYVHERRFLAEHDVLMLTSTLGMMMMAGAQDLIVFFVGLELLSVPLYALAVSERLGVEACGVYLPTTPKDLRAYLRNADDGSKVAELVARPDGALAPIARRVLALVDEVRRGLVAPLPTHEGACRTCSLHGACRKPRFAMTPDDDDGGRGAGGDLV